MRWKYEGEIPHGWASRFAISILVGVGWMIFLILFLAFYAEGFTVYKNLAIILASILVVFAILAPMWVHWAIKTASVWEKKVKKRKARK